MKSLQPGGEANVAFRGQTLVLGLMIGIVVIIMALAFTPVLKQQVDDARNATSDTQVGLDCTNSTISKYDKVTCITTDASQAIFFWSLLGIAGAFIGAKLLGVEG